MWARMASRTRWAGALPHALLDSCQRPTQIRGRWMLGVSEKRVSVCMAIGDVFAEGHWHPGLLFLRLYALVGK